MRKREARGRGIKKPVQINERVIINMAATYSPGLTRVPSAMGDLTSLFGMGRGEHPRLNHHKIFISYKFQVISCKYEYLKLKTDYLPLK